MSSVVEKLEENKNVFLPPTKKKCVSIKLHI